MSDAAVDEKSAQSGMARWRHRASVFGLVIAIGVLLLSAFVAPDGGMTAKSLRGGIAIAAVIAAAPLAAMARHVEAPRVVSLGGAMSVAGVATMVGGNLAGLLMAVAGTLILLVGASQQPPISAGISGRLVAYAVLLALAMWLAVGAGVLTTIIALFLAVVVATSSLWDAPR
ncbi:MAG: hypothetical protein ACRDU9_06035, partial [Acidimicrobiia bacterium]